MSTNRAAFLASLAAATAVPSLKSSPSASPHHGKRSFDFNEVAFTRILNKPARHKQCFGAKQIDGGSVLAAMNNSMDAYENFLGEGAGSP